MRKIISFLGIVIACFILLAFLFRPTPQQVFNVGKKLAEYQAFDRFRCNLAILAYKLAIKMDNSYVQPYYEVSDNLVNLAYRGVDSNGRDYYDQRILVEAKEYLRRAELLAPDAGELHKSRAYLISASGELKEAEKEAAIAVSMEPNNYRFHKMYGAILLENYFASNNRYFATQAIKEFQIALNNNPPPRQEGSILDFLGLTYMQAFGRVKEATRCFEESLRADPDNWVTLHHYNLAKEKIDDAEDMRHKNFALAVEMFKSNHNNAALYNTAKEYLDYSDYPQAEELFKQIIAKEPGNYEARSLLGYTYLEEGELDKAVEAFEQAIKINPKYADGYNQIGYIKYLQEDLNAAIDYCLKAVSLNKKDSNSYYRLGLIYEKLGDMQKTEEYFREAIGADPQNAQAYYALGITIGKNYDRFAGIPYYQKAVDLDISDDYCYVYLANLYGRMKQYKKAQQVLETALDKGRALSAEGLSSLAWCYVQQNINQEAAVFLALRARFMAPHILEIVDTLSKAYVNLGRKYLEQSHFFKGLLCYFLAGYVWVDSFMSGFLFIFILIFVLLQYVPRLFFWYSIKEDGIHFMIWGIIPLRMVLFKNIVEVRVLRRFEGLKYIFHRNWRNRVIGKQVLIRTKEGFIKEILLTPGKPAKFVDLIKSKLDPMTIATNNLENNTP
ncbi:MAG: tetratricopeptide repeat protein [bacterium]|nr:tetratricopeptide repeat protein [bacterium]